MASITLYGMRYVPVQEYQFEDTEYSHLLPQEGWVLVEVVESDGWISHNIDGVPLVGIGKSVFENGSFRGKGVEFGFTADQNNSPDIHGEGGERYGREYGQFSDPDMYSKSKIAFIDSNAFKNYNPGLFAAAMNIGDFKNIAYIGRSAFDSSRLLLYVTFMNGFEGKTIIFKEDAFKNCTLSSSIDIYANAVIESNAFNGATFQTYGNDLNISVRGAATIGKFGFVHDGKATISLNDIVKVTDTIVENIAIKNFELFTNILTISEGVSPIFRFKEGSDAIEDFNIYTDEIVGKVILPDNVKADRFQVTSRDGLMDIQGLNESTINAIYLNFPYDYDRANTIENFGNYSMFFDTNSININKCIIKNSFNHSYFSSGELEWIESYSSTVQNSFNYSPISRIRDGGIYSDYSDNLVENSFFHNLNATEDGKVGFLSSIRVGYYDDEKQKKAHFNTNLKLFTENKNHIYLGNTPIDESKFSDRLYVNRQRVYPIINYGYKSILRNVEIPGDWTLENTRIVMNNEFIYITVRNSDGYDDLYKISKETRTAEKMGLAAPNWKDFALILNEDGLTFMGGIVKDEPGFKKVFQLNGSRRHVRNLNDTDQQFGQTYKVANTYYSMSAGNVYFMGDGKYSRNRITRILKGDNGNILLPQGDKVVLWHEFSERTYTFIREGNPKNVGSPGPAKSCKVEGYPDGVHSVTVSGYQFALLTEDGRLVVGGLGNPDGKYKEINKRVDMDGLQQVFSIDGYLCLKYTDKVMYCDMATIDSDDWHVAYDDTLTVINSYGHFGIKRHGNKINIYSMNQSDFTSTETPF